MPVIKTEAIVLRTRPWRETSLIVDLLTRSNGRLGAVSRGARRGKSNTSAQLQPGAIVKVQLNIKPKASLATLTGVDLHVPPPATAARRNQLNDPGQLLVRSAYAGLYGEVLTHTRENDPHAADLFDIAAEFFTRLGATPHPGSVALHALFHLLAALGFGIDLPESKGKSNIEIDLLSGEYHISKQAAGPTGHGGFVITPRAHKALHAILFADTPPTIPRSVGPLLTRLIIQLFQTQLETRLKSARYIEEMVLQLLPK